MNKLTEILKQPEGRKLAFKEAVKEKGFPENWLIISLKNKITNYYDTRKY